VDNTLNALFDAVEAIGGQTVEQARVDDVLYLSEKRLVFGNSIQYPSNACETGDCSQYGFTIIIISILSDQPNILLLQMLANICCKR
jgi:hypothetical protein